MSAFHREGEGGSPLFFSALSAVVPDIGWQRRHDGKGQRSDLFFANGCRFPPPPFFFLIRGEEV